MVNRVAWWKEYTHATPVVVGHYWRWPTKVNRTVFEKDGPDLFADARPTDWLGPRRNAFCVDFSIGRRYRERELMFDTGDRQTTDESA